MIIVTHALVGAVIGKNITNPIAVVGLAFAAHFLLDTVHHGEYLNSQSKFKDTAWKVALDLLVGTLLVFIYIRLNNFDFATKINILLGSAASIFPDFVTLIYWIFPNKFLGKIYRFHKWAHERNPLYKADHMLWNLKNARNDILISLTALFILFL